MKSSYKFTAAAAGAGIFPAVVFAVLEGPVNSGHVAASAAAAAAAALGGWLLALSVKSGLTRPMDKMAASVKAFIAADYKLEAALAKEGWPEAQGVTSALNRLMLELSAYRAFHLNQVVEERAKAQALIETITDGILLVDDRGRLIYSNQLALKLLGIPRQQADVALPGSASQKEFQPALEAIMASEESYLRAEVTVAGPDEEYSVAKNFRVMSRQFFLATLKRPGRVIVISDVTVEKEIECARETFFHMITHDMRTPLTSILGYAQMMTMALPAAAPEKEKYMQPILRSAQRLNGMIADILNTIKLERGDMRLGSAPVDACALCAGVYEAHEPLAARKKITLSAPKVTEKIEFTGDQDLLDRVLSNLVGNSLKFTPPGGSVTIACRAAGGEVIFSVEDTGPGVPKEKQNEIFEKYTQLEEHKHMGFGLGLAMCKLAVGLHKGRIWIESEEGKGSRFLFSVPLKQPAA